MKHEVTTKNGDTYYRGWEITKIRNGSWKATKGSLSIHSVSAMLLRALIDENEGK